MNLKQCIDLLVNNSQQKNNNNKKTPPALTTKWQNQENNIQNISMSVSSSVNSHVQIFTMKSGEKISYFHSLFSI